MKKLLVSVVAAASLAIPIGWETAASAAPHPDPDANGDVHSNCHTGSKFRGAGGEDAGPGNPKDTSDDANCVPGNVPPPGTPGVNPGSAQSAAQARAAAAAAARAPAVPVAGAAAAVSGVPRTTG